MKNPMLPNFALFAAAAALIGGTLHFCYAIAVSALPWTYADTGFAAIMLAAPAWIAWDAWKRIVAIATVTVVVDGEETTGIGGRVEVNAPPLEMARDCLWHTVGTVVRTKDGTIAEVVSVPMERWPNGCFLASVDGLCIGCPGILCTPEHGRPDGLHTILRRIAVATASVEKQSGQYPEIYLVATFPGQILVPGEALYRLLPTISEQKKENVE